MIYSPINPNRWLTLLVTVIGSFLVFLDIVIINIVMPNITSHYNSTIGESGWIISGYTLAMSIMLLCSGWFARKYGFKRLYIIGVLIFTIGSFFCSIAPNLNTLIAMRMLQGIGGGIITPLAMSIIALNFKGKSRSFALGLLIMTIGFTISIGPILGGYLVKIDEWIWIFKMNIPIGSTLIFMSIFLMKEYRVANTPRLDYIGVLLLFIWAPLSLYILSSHFEWQLILVLIISFTLFILRMMYARNPLINIQIFKSTNFILSFIILFCFGFVSQGGNYILSEYLLLGVHYSAYDVGLIFLPVGIIQGVIAPITGSLIPKFGNRIFILMGFFVLLIYVYLSSNIHFDTPYWYISTTLYLRGLGVGLASTALTNLSLSGIKDTEIDSASGVINTVKQLSGSFSIAIITLILISNSTQNKVINDSGYVNTTDSSFLILFGVTVVAIIATLAIKWDRKNI